MATEYYLECGKDNFDLTSTNIKDAVFEAADFIKGRAPDYYWLIGNNTAVAYLKPHTDAVEVNIYDNGLELIRNDS